MVLPALAAAKLASVPGNVNKYLHSKSNVVEGVSKGERAWKNFLVYGGAVTFVVVVMAMGWYVFIKEPSTAPDPMDNIRVSNRENNSGHQEYMFSNKKLRRKNNYRNQKRMGGDEFGGYYGIHPRGFSQGDPRMKPKIGQTMEIDPAGADEEEYEELAENFIQKESRRKKRLSKSINTGIYNTGHIQQVSEINTATNLSAGNDFTSAFSRNSGERNIQRYIQPLEPRGVSSDALNFASITK